MPTYKAPVDDYRFLLFDFFRVQDMADVPGLESMDEELVSDVLNAGAKVCEDLLQPLNQVGDEHGCTFENGVVRTPPGFKEAYKEFCEGGWNALGAPEELGGAGMPSIISFTMNEMLSSANQAFGMYPGLTSAAYSALAATGAPWMREHIVKRMVSGEWSGTMCLTEPHCGTDLKLMKTKAVEQEDGTYRLTGTKIFISGGEQDLTDNIVHMVIAKVPNEDGKLENDLSTVNFFMVPKFLVSEDGKMGARNGVSCGSIEKKMGIKGSSTCVMNFDEAIAWRLGPKPEPKKEGAEGKGKSKSAGMAGMFGMMNAARIGVGVQGYAVAEVAYQNAAIYANERLTGRALTGAKNPDGPADPIIVHPDVRRMLLHARSFAEGARAMGMWVNLAFSISRSKREDAEEMGLIADMLTPVVKAFFTDMGFEAANASMQCFGGHGYVRDHGMEQFVRDSRINQVYEGANGIQALDLVGRKLSRAGGKAPFALFGLIDSFIKENSEGEIATYTAPLASGLKDLQDATLWLAENGPKNPDNVGAGSVDYLRMFGIITVGWFWAQMAKSALDAIAQGKGDKTFYERKLVLARYWMERMVPETASLSARSKMGADGLMELQASGF